MQEMIINPLIGGLLISIASTLMLWALGRITGITGIFTNNLRKFTVDNQWRYAFLVGLVFGGFVMSKLKPELFIYVIETNWVILIISGLLIGIGTSIGSGYTSVHGFCGVLKLSSSSIWSTIIYVSFAVMTVFIMGRIFV